MKGVFDMKQKAIILKKPSGTIAVAGNLTKTQRKFYNGFLYVAKKTLERDVNVHWFEVDLAELKQFLNVQEQDKNNATFREIIKELTEIKVEYNILNKDSKIEGYAHLLDNIQFKTDFETSRVYIKYSIPFVVREAMIDKNYMYASIDLIVIKGLTSKYSILAYELAKDYENVEIPLMTISEFRRIFGIDDKYKRMFDVKRRVLDVICEEINNNDNISFRIDYELFRKGRVYTHIKFNIKKKQKKSSKDNKQLQKNKAISINNDILNLLKIKNDKIINEINNCLQTKGQDYVMRTIEFVNEQANVKNYGGFLIAALRENWAKEYDNKGIDIEKITKMLEEKRKYLNFCKRYEGKKIKFGRVVGKFVLHQNEYRFMLDGKHEYVGFKKIKEAIDKGAQVEILEEVLEED